jgi:hypothetical protein
MFSEKFKTNVDVESVSDDAYLHNDTIESIYWDNVSVKLKDKDLLDSIDGAASAGQFKPDNDSNSVPAGTWDPVFDVSMGTGTDSL